MIQSTYLNGFPIIAAVANLESTDRAANGITIAPSVTTGADFEKILSAFPNLRALRMLSGTDEALELLRDRELTYLQLIMMPSITDHAGKVIAKMPHLSDLSLMDLPVGDSFLAEIAGSQSLQSLDISTCFRITSAGLSPFRSSHLRQFHMDERCDDEALRQLAKAPELEDIVLDSDGLFTGQGVAEFVSAATALATIELSGRTSTGLNRMREVSVALSQLNPQIQLVPIPKRSETEIAFRVRRTL